MRYQPKPSWIKVRPPAGPAYTSIARRLREKKLHTVCEEALCPNIAECWQSGTATLMLLGETCTRGCRFCAVNSGNPKGIVDSLEPEKTAQTIEIMNLEYVVLTMVDRDDLEDGGSDHVAQTISHIHRRCPNTSVEILASDFQGNEADIARVLDAKPQVFAHNIETTQALTPFVRDRKSTYQKSLNVLDFAKKYDQGAQLTKSSIMVGLGETAEEILKTCEDLREVGVDFLTLGQYLQPSQKHLAVKKYYHPDEFEALKEKSLALGFKYVASGPLVRSSYKAAEFFISSYLKKQHMSPRSDYILPTISA